MSFVSGTATDYLDLLSKLKAFLTTDATLAGLTPPQTWVVNRDVSPPQLAPSGTVPLFSGILPGDREIQLQWKGLAGTDNFYGSITAYHDTANDIYNWSLRGQVGYSVPASLEGQPGVSNASIISLWNQSMPYWIFGNGRRVILVVKVSTTYEMLYIGSILQYGTPSQMPYPFFFGATQGYSYTVRFSTSDFRHRAFFDPGAMGAYFRDTAGVWRVVANEYSNTGGTPQDGNTTFTYPYGGSSINRALVAQLRQNQDLTYTLTPVEIIQSNYSVVSPTIPINENVWGALDGVYHITGFGLGSEDTVTVGGVTYLVFADTSRTGAQNYVALKEA